MFCIINELIAKFRSIIAVWFSLFPPVDSTEIYSVELYDDGTHTDSLAGDGLYSGKLDAITVENEFNLSMNVVDNDTENDFVFNDNKRLTTIGPIIVNSHEFIQAFGTRYILRLSLENEGLLATANAVKAEITSTDNIQITNIYQPDQDGIVIAAGDNVDIEGSFGFDIESTLATIPLVIKIFSNDYPFWNYTIDLVTGIDDELTNLPNK